MRNIENMLYIESKVSNAKTSIVGFKSVITYIESIVSRTDKKVAFEIKTVGAISRRSVTRRFYVVNVDIKLL